MTLGVASAFYVFSVSRLSFGIDVVAVPTAIAVILAVLDNWALHEGPDCSARNHACSSTRNRVNSNRGPRYRPDRCPRDCARHSTSANVSAMTIGIMSARAERCGCCEA